MLTLTLDTNCIVALDEDREPDAACIRRLLALHDQGATRLRLTSSSASERQQDLTYLSNFDQFKARIEGLGLASLERLPPPATFDVSYWDNSVFVGEDDILLIERIHQALFPGQRSDLAGVLEDTNGEDRPKAEGKWRNRLMDVYALWCHINYHDDVFVTTDRRFARKPASLIEIFPSLLIKTPCEVASYIGAP